ncbi:MAG: FHA domain-containing protein [Propionibacteriaceae bacterium]|jgi:S-DNA-T family DNA segregation ATPase FtsK/SpoIIIE|nr:FHA domain-containing protein [Propionibacteriaceae bacterium]
MRIKLSLALPNGPACAATVTAEGTATVSEIAAAIQAGLTQIPTPPDRVLSLQILSDRDELLDVLPPRSLLSETSLRSGQRVRVVQWVEGVGRGASSPARLKVLTGVNAGKSYPLRFGPNIIGRDEECDITLMDRFVSRQHDSLILTDQIEIADLHSSNGLVIKDVTVDHAVLGPSDTVVIGETTVMVEPSPELAGRVVSINVDFNRSPLVREPYEGKKFEVPAPPERPQSGKLPWIAMVTPLVMGAVLYFTQGRSPMSMIFVAMSPLISMITFLDSIVTDRLAKRKDRRQFSKDMADLTTTIEEALDEERQARSKEVLPLGAILEAGFRKTPDLWHRRPDDEAFLSINLGYGKTKSRHELKSPERRGADGPTWALVEEVVKKAEFVEDVPIVVGLRTVGNLGLSGPRDWVDLVARNYVAQLVCQHSPAEVSLAALASSDSCGRWEWLMWLSHVGSTHSPLGGPHLASTAPAVSALVSQLEELVAARKSKTRSAVTIPAVVVLVENDAPVERGRLVTIAEDGPAVGVHMIWLAESQEDLPAACRAYLNQDAQQQINAGFVDERRLTEITRVEPLTAQLAEDMAHRLSPILDAGAPIVDQSDIPRAVSYLSLIGPSVADDPQVTVERWVESGSLHNSAAPRGKAPATLRAMVGQGAQGEFSLDIRTQGPHALVGGTTGSGKSEFLQSWVLGMATNHSPQRVTFLFVDYKGGAAFADCIQLPHSVGLVTDLSPHLVRRALTSLRAELRYREHLLNQKKAKDLLALERLGDPECPPALIIVVDEFAALAKEVPEFVDGVVDVAQRGRSLGLHLILATQRPAGVITSNLRANTNLRIALRMADETDSTDVIDVPLAGEFDPRVPGRGAVRTGPGRVALFQAGYAGGRTSSEPEPASIEIETMRFGAGTPWEIPDTRAPSRVSDEGPTDIARVVSMVRAAAEVCRLPEPRKPWLAELATRYDLGSLPKLSLPGELVPLGMADDPGNQSQHSVYFDPDQEGNLAIYGVSGSGKSTVLRSIAYHAAANAAQYRTEIYGLDFSTAGLAMLEDLPTVGAIIDGSDFERVGRVLERLIGILEDRSASYAQARAGSITQYRAATGKSAEARILLLVDGLSAFREKYEVAASTARTYNRFARLAIEGRAVGIHVVLTAERPGALPSSLGAAFGRRLILRQVDEAAYMTLGIPKDVLGPDSCPGRAVFSGESNEVQIATPGAATTPAEQGHQFDQLAAQMRAAGIRPTAPVERLTSSISIGELPTEVAGLPVLGISEDNLQPFGFHPQGGFVVTGMAGAGSGSALRTITQSLRRWNPDIPIYYFGPQRSRLASEGGWAGKAHSHEDIKALALELKARAAELAPGDIPGLILVIESITDLVSSPCEAAVVELLKLARRNGHLIIGEHELSGWSSSWPLIAEIRNDRRGLVMQPDPSDGDILFKVAFPRVKRADYPPGRCVYAQGGKTWTVQLGDPAETSPDTTP